MQSNVTRAEIIRFLVKTDGYIAAPATAGKQARVYGSAPGVEMAAYAIPDAMLKSLIDEYLVIPESGTSGGSQRYKLTDKALRSVSRLRDPDRDAAKKEE